MSIQDPIKQMASKDQKSNVRKQIDENLRRTYEDALNEEVPDKFLQLIEQLKSAERKGDADDS